MKLTKSNAMSTAMAAWAALDMPEPFMQQEHEGGGTLMVRRPEAAAVLVAART